MSKVASTQTTVEDIIELLFPNFMGKYALVELFAERDIINYWCDFYKEYIYFIDLTDNSLTTHPTVTDDSKSIATLPDDMALVSFGRYSKGREKLWIQVNSDNLEDFGL